MPDLHPAPTSTTNVSLQPHPTCHGSAGVGCDGESKSTSVIVSESTTADVDVCLRTVAVQASPPEVMKEMRCPGAADSGQQYPSTGREVELQSLSSPVAG
jgi:hypothetical protein